MKNMILDLIMVKIKSLMFYLFLRFYYYYNLIWDLVFSWLGQIMFLFYIDCQDNELSTRCRNITWNYYLNYNMDKFKKGTYYAKILNVNGINQLAFNGNIMEINNRILPQNKPKRKNIILQNNSIPINIDLKVLDNYKMSISGFNNPITNMGQILDLLGIPCTEVSIIRMHPFSKITLPINDVDIDYLYQ